MTISELRGQLLPNIAKRNHAKADRALQIAIDRLPSDPSELDDMKRRQLRKNVRASYQRQFNGDKSLDPVTLGIIIQILAAIIQYWLANRTNRRAVNALKGR